MTELELIIDLHLGGDRQGPGSEAHTKRAIDLLHLDQGRSLSIADIGCGTGAQTMVLAQSLEGKIKAVDLSDKFLEKLNENARKFGLDDKIETITASMEKLPFEYEELDVVWSEGAIYSMGFKNGLNAWKKYLKPNGFIGVSEISWIKESVPEELEKFWKTAYDEIDTVANKINVIESSGYKMLGHFILPEDCWKKNYYQPLLKRIPAFLENHKHSELAKAMVENEKKEMELYEKYKDYYSYGFYVAQKV